MSRPRPRVIGAPTNLGLAPHPDGSPRQVHLAPRVLRAHGMVERLDAEDLGDVWAPPYRDLVRGDLAIRNADLIATHARALAAAVQQARSTDARLLLVGGDCSVVLGALLGLRASGRFGLIFLDGHCDFAPPALSPTGGAAGMDLALAVGAIDHPLARLAGGGPLVEAEHVVLLARKDLADEPKYGPHSVRHTDVDDLPLAEVVALGTAATAERALARLGKHDLDGFWIHLDVDVLPPGVMPAVDSPEPGGLPLDATADLLQRLLAHPGAVGMDLTIYDPALDPEGACARRLVDLLADVFGAPLTRTTLTRTTLTRTALSGSAPS